MLIVVSGDVAHCPNTVIFPVDPTCQDALTEQELKSRRRPAIYWFECGRAPAWENGGFASVAGGAGGWGDGHLRPRGAGLWCSGLVATVVRGRATCTSRASRRTAGTGSTARRRRARTYGQQGLGGMATGAAMESLATGHGAGELGHDHDAMHGQERRRPSAAALRCCSPPSSATPMPAPWTPTPRR